MHLNYRRTCRVCGSNSLTRVIDLGSQRLQGAFIKQGLSSPSSREVPMSLVRCDPQKDEHACGLLQTEHAVPPELLYRHYWYRSGTNQTMKDHLKSIVTDALEMLGSSASAVLDVGCNDGTLLNFYADATALVGIDPSNIIPASLGRAEFVKDFFPSSELRIKYANRKFDIITSVAMFYDLDDPVGFAKELAHFLSPAGLWVLEMSYMPQMLAQGSYDSICHEHVEYYSLAVLENLVGRANLQVVRAQFNSMNGGSVRLFVAHKDCLKYKSDSDLMILREMRVNEFDMELDTDKPYRLFQDRAERQRTELRDLLKELKAAGKRIHLYGASTKGNTILQWCNIDSRLVEYAADRNPEKWGALTPGTEIPIISEEQSRKSRPDYYLVLPWHFKEEFLKREKATLAAGTSLIFPLPEVEVVRA